MPVYNAPLLRIDPKETRRYAGLMRAKDFDERLTLAILAHPFLILKF